MELIKGHQLAQDKYQLGCLAVVHINGLIPENFMFWDYAKLRLKNLEKSYLNRDIFPLGV